MNDNASARSAASDQSDGAAPSAPSDPLAPAFAALKVYDRGAARAALLPIDEATAAASAGDSPARPQLEERLVAALESGGSVVAREYICARLALVGSARCVNALVASLAETEVATAARRALEALPCPEAGAALRASLATLNGLAKVGVINSLGHRRDTGSVEALSALLREPEPQIARAAAAALGRVGSAQAGEALAAFLAQAPVEQRRAAADAVLRCAEALWAAGRRAEAQGLCRKLLEPGQSAWVQEAARRKASG